MFQVLSVQLACEKCKEEGKAADCIHLLHLVPRWQSGDRHTRLKVCVQFWSISFVLQLKNPVSLSGDHARPS